MIDFSSVSVEDLLGRLGIGNARMTSSGKEIKFDCFGPEHSDGGSAYINVDSTLWMCHGCHRKGNAVNLVMEVHGIPRPAAETTLRDWFGIQFDEPIGGSMVAETETRFRETPPDPPPALAPKSWLNAVRLDWSRGPYEPFQEYMLQRGFSAEALTEYDIGYDYFSDRLTIPVFTADGELMGIKGRDWTGEREPKYLVLGDRPGFARYGFVPYEGTQVVFGLHRNREYRQVVLFEGELNAIAASQAGVPRPIAIGMSYFSERHAQFIVREAEDVVVFYDQDSAGRDAVKSTVEILEPYVRVRVVESPPEDAAQLLQDGRCQEIPALIDSAVSPLALNHLFV